jgi:hypothetical protein
MPDAREVIVAVHDHQVSPHSQWYIKSSHYTLLGISEITYSPNLQVIHKLQLARQLKLFQRSAQFPHGPKGSFLSSPCAACT